MEKFLIWLVKIILMIGLLAAAAVGCFFIIILRHGLGWGHNSVLSIFDLLLDIFLCLAIFALYIFLCIKIIRFNLK